MEDKIVGRNNEKEKRASRGWMGNFSNYEVYCEATHMKS